ncbi:hypothetical protein D3C76_1414980 [compost metagenome]
MPVNGLEPSISTLFTNSSLLITKEIALRKFSFCSALLELIPSSRLEAVKVNTVKYSGLLVYWEMYSPDNDATSTAPDSYKLIPVPMSFTT